MTEINQKVKDLYLKKYVRENLLPNRFINWGRNTKLSKVLGFIGGRGSLKSLSASAMSIVDYLIPGYDVYSNMSIGWGIHLGDNLVTYKSKNLDQADLLTLNMEKALVVIDEINLEFSEARRSMTNRNLQFNQLIQQIRKKKLNVIYTVQHEMWIDSRLRWQTDMFISCEDVLFRPGGLKLPFDWGEIGFWKVYDERGILGQGTHSDTNKTFDFTFYGKRWWNTFDTNELQMPEEERYGAVNYKEAQFSPVRLQMQEAVQRIVQDAIAGGEDRLTMSDAFREISQQLRTPVIGNAKLEKEARLLLRQATQVEPKRTNSGYYFPLDEILDFKYSNSMNAREMAAVT